MFCFCTVVPTVRWGGGYQGCVLYRQKRQCNENITAGEKRRWFYQLAVAVLLHKKSKSPLFPGARGPWLQMTGA